jgi:hypothetical protein
VQEGTYSFYGLGCRDIDPFERLVDGVREGENVMGGLPIRVLVGGAKARYPNACRIGERSAEIGGSGPSRAATVRELMISVGSSPRRLSDTEM